MPKKSVKHARVQESSSTPVAAEKAKRHRSVHIGPKNGRRWLSLKKRLGLHTDDELVVYLLDLADSISAQKEDDGEGSSESWKTECVQEKEVSDTKETPTSTHNIYHIELPRRSLRNLANAEETLSKQKSEKVERLDVVPKESEKILQQDVNFYVKCSSKTSKSKRHKSKVKHHKEKRKKRKHQKNKELKDIIGLDNSTVDNSSWELDPEIDGEKCSANLSHSISPILLDQSFDNSISSSSKKIIYLQKPEPSEDLNKSTNSYKADISYDQITTSCTEEQMEEEANEEQNNIQDLEVQSTLDTANKFVLDLDQSFITQSKKISINIKNINDSQDSDYESGSKRSRPSKGEINDSSTIQSELDKDYLEETFSSHKREKKKHKGEHQSKKHRDVRKAPQDGIVSANEEENVVTCSNLLVTSTDVDTSVDTSVPDNTLSSDVINENADADLPRLAIKIKLCQDCNSRHLQDACPLTDPEYTVKDSISLEEWLQQNNDNSEAMKAFNSDDPMSKGYSKNTDDGFESDEETSEQYKSKLKVECEEKLQTFDANKPLYSRDSLPECLEFKLSNMDHGLGVFVKTVLPVYAKLGPLIGKPVQEMDIPDDFSMRHIWEVNNNNRTLYISTTNPLNSNWIRYVRPADSKEERNVAVMYKNGELYLVTSKPLATGTELTYWSESQSTAWAKKNKIDKTNCGGCNLNFTHPIYYRLHCCIFHDTNYSLTIRKYHCKVCGVAVLGKDNIMKHAAQLHAGRGAYQCQYCKKFFLRLNYLEMHRTYGCSQNPQRSRPLCDFCGRKFCQPQKLKVHIKRMHSDMSEVLREFQCKLCLKLLGSRAALQRHMKEVHHKDVVGAATCDRCGKMFQNKSNLKIHMLTHSGVKPFKCKEDGCKAAFTTKQCLQFHYKKVHGLSEEMMPKIERSVAYTFDAYSGGLVEDVGRGKTPKFAASTSQENNDSLASFDDCSSENNNSSTTTEFQQSSMSKSMQEIEAPVQEISTTVPVADSAVESADSDTDIYTTPRLSTSKADKKWMNEFNPVLNTTPAQGVAESYNFEESRKDEEKIHSSSQNLIDDAKLGVSVYRRTESASASLLVEAALDAAEREIGAVSSPILEDSDRETNLYSIPNELDFKVACSQSQVVHKSPDTNLDSYIQDELAGSPTTTSHIRHSPISQVHLDYHIHRPVDYVNSNSRTHNIEQYLDQQDIQRVIHVSQDIQTSPTRYQEMSHSHVHPHSQTHGHPHPHHQHHSGSNEALSSDEGDAVAQNLSLSVKEKSLQQLDLSKYDGLETEFSLVNRDRVRFEPLIVQSTVDQGLDMSARSFHQAFESQVQSSSHHHHHHLYEMTDRERQGVDLSRTAACISPSPYPPPPPPYPPPYSHVDVSRVVSLEPSARSSHHLHTSVSRLITSPQPGGSLSSHLMTDSLEARIMSPPPPSMHSYNASYSVGTTPYHASRSGYHYSGYY